MLTIRIQRLWRHLSGQRPTFLQTYPQHFAWRCMEALLLLGDCLFLPGILIFFHQIFKLNTRRLTAQEIHLAQSVFGNSIDYQKVRIDERAQIGCKKYHFAYVSFYLINAWGKMSEPHLIHEMVHVWQYQRLGSVYIPRALYAQRTPEGYNYGGIKALRQMAEQGRGLADFNFEQQGDVVADYFCLLRGFRPRWCASNREYLVDFERVLEIGIYSDVNKN